MTDLAKNDPSFFHYFAAQQAIEQLRRTLEDCIAAFRPGDPLLE